MRDDGSRGGGIRFELAAPVLAVTDLTFALAFYRDVLGFGVDWTWGSPPEMAAVSRDSVELHLSAPPEGAEGCEAPRSRVYCFIRGVDRYAAAVRERGGEILHEPADQPYGMRDFDIDDPDGNRICFGEPTVE